MYAGRLGQVAGTLGRDDHEGHGSVALLAAVEQVQRLGDHPRRLVVGQRDRLVVEEGVRVGRRMAPVRDRHPSEVLGRRAVLMHVTTCLHGDRRGGRAQPHRVGPRVVQPVGVHLRGGSDAELAEATARALVEPAVADHHVRDARGDGHRGLLDGRARGAPAVVDPAEEPQLLHPQLAGDRNLRGGVHRERRQAVHVGGGEAAVGQRGLDGLDRELELGASRLLGELRRPDADDCGLARQPTHADARAVARRTVPVMWAPSETEPVTASVTTPSSTDSTWPVKVSVS